MKKVIMFLIVMAAMITSCGKTDKSSVKAETEKEAVKQVTNEEVFSDLIAGLQERWDIVNLVTQDTSEVETKNLYKEGVQKELDKIGKYKKQEFKDEELGNLITKYIVALEMQKDAFEYEEDEKYTEYWDKGREARTEYLKTINSEYQLYKLGDDDFRIQLQDMINVYEPIDSDKITDTDWTGLYVTDYENIKNYSFFVDGINKESKTGTVLFYSTEEYYQDSKPVKAVLIDNQRLYFEFVDEAHSENDSYTVKFILAKSKDNSDEYSLVWKVKYMNESTDSNVYDFISTFYDNKLENVKLTRVNEGDF